jgi:hypothetical protein
VGPGGGRVPEECCEFLDISLVILRSGVEPGTQILRRRGTAEFWTRSIEGADDGVLVRDDGDAERLDKLSGAASSELSSASGPKLLTMIV